MSDQPTCEGCGACCLEVGAPPFLGFEIHDLPEDLRNEVLEKGFESADQDKVPCYWLNTDTGLCKNYEKRPQVCRDFELGGVSCLSYRKYHSID